VRMTRRRWNLPRDRRLHVLSLVCQLGKIFDALQTSVELDGLGTGLGL
jgi:hypothetical protein